MHRQYRTTVYVFPVTMGFFYLVLVLFCGRSGVGSFRLMNLSFHPLLTRRRPLKKELVLHYAVAGRRSTQP